MVLLKEINITIRLTSFIRVTFIYHLSSFLLLVMANSQGLKGISSRVGPLGLYTHLLPSLHTFNVLTTFLSLTSTLA